MEFVGSTSHPQAGPLTPDVRRQIARVCEQVAATLPELSYQIVREIRAEIPDYAVVPLGEHQRFVAEHARALLAGIAEQRPPQAEQVQQAREHGRLRARMGLAIELLLGAYHIIYREIWNAILRQAIAEDPGLAGYLAYLVNLIWTWVRVLTSSASDAYSEELRRSQVTQASLRHRLLAALTADPPDTELAGPLARALGYQPDGDFQALSMPAGDWPDDQAERLQQRLAALPGHPHFVTEGAVTVILGQHPALDPILAAIRQCQQRPGPVGIGLRRPGLAGAAASITDARDALGRARPGHLTVRFADDWLAISLSPQATRLAPLFTPAAATAQASPHLAEAVLAFAGHGLSIAAAARALHLHPNSLAYRLSRWHELTGWDPRNGDGLAASLVALRLYQGTGASESQAVTN